VENKGGLAGTIGAQQNHGLPRAQIKIHAAKGLEWPTVIGVNCIDGVYPSRRSDTTAEDLAEDLRVFYVMITRSRDDLILTVPKSQRVPWEHWDRPAIPSPYLLNPGHPEVEADEEPLPEPISDDVPF